MLDALSLSCFTGRSPSSPAAAGPRFVTSVYDTRVGIVSLSWSRAAFGLALRVVLRLSADGGGEEDDEEETLGFRVRPWLLRKRKGSSKFQLRGRRVEIAWDLSTARFPAPGAPEPVSGYFVSVAVGGEVALLAGDLRDGGPGWSRYAKHVGLASLAKSQASISRREHVVLRDTGSGRRYRTVVRHGGKEREVAVDLVARNKEKSSVSRGASEVGMVVAIDGERVLHVKQLRWKFRGSEIVMFDGGERVQISWDLHNWMFTSREVASASSLPSASTPLDAASSTANAVFVFRFMRNEQLEGVVAGNSSNEEALGGSIKRRGWADWSGSSSGEERRRMSKGKRPARGTSSPSASVTSSASSWASGASVMDWSSVEEAEMLRISGFSLLVYAWKI